MLLPTFFSDDECKVACIFKHADLTRVQILKHARRCGRHRFEVAKGTLSENNILAVSAIPENAQDETPLYTNMRSTILRFRLAWRFQDLWCLPVGGGWQSLTRTRHERTRKKETNRLQATEAPP
jgi:hypothetical protein